MPPGDDQTCASKLDDYIDKLTNNKIFKPARARLKWVLSYLRTWKALLIAPRSVIQSTRPGKFVDASAFVGATSVLFGAATYVWTLITHNPLTPPTRTAVFSAFAIGGFVVCFVLAWALCVIYVPRLFRRRRAETPKFEFGHLRRALTYMLGGPGLFWTAVAVTVALAIGMLLQAKAPTIMQEGNPIKEDVVMVLGFLVIAIAISPTFIACWLTTRAVRSFCPTGKFVGIVLPSILFLMLLGAVNWTFLLTNPSRLSNEERKALGMLWALSDSESITHAHTGSWQADISALRDCCWNPDHELILLFGLDPFMHDTSKYATEMDGYRYSVEMFNGGRDCVIWASPSPYNPPRKQSFGTLCTLLPINRFTVAEDARGGNPTLSGGRIVLATPWDKINYSESDKRVTDHSLTQSSTDPTMLEAIGKPVTEWNSDGSMRVQWQTNLPSSTEVQYGADHEHLNGSIVGALGKDHAVLIPPIETSELFVRIKSKTTAGQHWFVEYRFPTTPKTSNRRR